MRIRPLLIPSLVILTASGLFAQDSQQRLKEQIEKDRELDRQAVVLLTEITSATSTLKLPENRAYLLAGAADLLWDHDEKLARNLFWESLNNVNLISTSLSSGNSGQNASKQQIVDAYLTAYGVKRQILRSAARYDPQFALGLLNSNRLAEGNESELEREIAAEATARDPKRALKAATDSLAKGWTREITYFLYKLNAVNRELGTKFVADIIEKLQDENLADNTNAVQVAIDVLIVSREGARMAFGGVRAGQVKLTDEQRRDLVEMVTNAALSVTSNSQAFLSIEDIMSEVEQFTPSRVVPLKQKFAETKRNLNKEQKAWDEHNTLVRSGNPEEMLRGAANADEEQRTSLEDQAIITAVMLRQVDSFREVIKNEVEDESRRNKLIDQLDAQAIDIAAGRGDDEMLQKMLGDIRRKEQRGRAMARLAMLLDKRGNHVLTAASKIIRRKIQNNKRHE